MPPRTSEPSSPRRSVASFALATAAYVVVALWFLSPVWPDPFHTLPQNDFAPAAAKLSRLDQQMVIGTVIRNASLLVSEPSALFDYGQCYPLVGSHALGEHMFGEGLLAAVPWAITGNPVLSFNVAILLALVLPGLTMFALARHFTRSDAAAFVGGLALMLSPTRLLDVTVHPYIYADYFLPLAILFLHRLLTRGGWINAIAVAVFLSLQTLESLYVLIGVAVVVLVYGAYGAWMHRDRPPRAWLPVLVAAAASLGCAWLILSPYLEMRDTWNTLSARAPYFLRTTDLLPGAKFFPGLVCVALASIAVLDRLRGPRPIGGEDPRLAMVAATLAVVWVAASRIEIPGTAVEIPGLTPSLMGAVPGLDAVRALYFTAVGIWVPIALLAAFGTMVLVERMSQRASIVFAVVLALALIGERRVPGLSEWRFGNGTAFRQVGWKVDIPAEDVALLREASRGATLHVPMPAPGNRVARLRMGRHLMLQSYDPRPTSLCYNSFGSPIEDQLHQLTLELPDPAAAEALATLGFGTVVSHERGWLPNQRAAFQRRLDAQPAPAQRTVDAGRTDHLRLFHLRASAPVTRNPAVLTSQITTPQRVPPGPGSVSITVGNPTDSTFVHPEPVRPTEAVVHWRRRGRTIASPQPTQILLPIALGPGAEIRVSASVDSPSEPGQYVAVVSRPGGEVLGRAAVVVEPEADAAS